MTLCCLLLAAANSSFVSAQTNPGNNASSIAKIKAEVAKRGIYERQLVVVKKLDGTKLKGYISQKGDDSFTLTDSKTDQTTVIAYSDVAQVKKATSGDKIALIIIGGAAAVGAIVLGSFLVKRCRNEGGC